MNQKKPNKQLTIAALKKGVTTKKGKKAAKKVAKSVSTVILSIFLIFIITACVLAGVGAIYVTQYAKGNADELDLYTLKYDQSQTTILYAYEEDQSVVELARLHGTENRTWVDLEKIPEHLQKAFISIEDERFYEHNGVDWKRTIASFANMFISLYDGTQGGSTITQQLIKNVTGDNEVTIVRKVNEIFTALELDKNYSKDVILECYLNEVYLGSGAYGVQAAAETYFGKNVEELNVAESATIAAITKYPYLLTPLVNPEKNRDRMEYCLSKMLELGFISQSEYEEALDYKLLFTNSPEYLQQKALEEGKDPEEAQEDKYQGYYVDYVIETIISDLREEYDMTRDEAVDKLYSGGLRVYTAVDLKIQGIIDDVFENYDGVPLSDGTPYEELENKDDQLPQASMVVMEYDGRVVGLSGGAGKKQGNLSLNRATYSQRSPGSAIKPLTVYAPAIDYNLITWSTKLPDQPIYLAGEGRWPSNFSKTYGPDMTVQKGVEISINTLPARIVQKLSLSTCFEFLTEKLHFKNLDPVDDVTYSAMATGGFKHGVTTLDMTAGFQIFGNGGVYNEPYCYYEIKDTKGDIVLSHEDNPEQVIDPDSATVMNKLLQTVMTGPAGTGRSYGLSNQTVFGKSGTTSDTKDRYWMGGTPYYIGGCWYGYDMPKRIRSSSNPAAKIWRAVMSEIHDGLERKSFSTSSGVVSRTYCVGSGNIAGDNCALTATGWYKSSNVPPVCPGGDQCWANESRLDLVESGLIPASSEVSSEVVTEPPTVPPTQAPTEPSTQAPTEPPTEVPTTAPNTPF